MHKVFWTLTHFQPQCALVRARIVGLAMWDSAFELAHGCISPDDIPIQPTGYVKPAHQNRLMCSDREVGQLLQLAAIYFVEHGVPPACP